jgi:hypothetical protein
MFRGQLAQLLVLAGLVALAVPVAPEDPRARGWYVAALALCALHHLWVSVGWRLELHARLVSRTLGHPRGFRGFQVGFATLALARVAAVWGLAYVDRDTLALPRALAWPLAAVCLAIATWLLVSVHRHFGMERAFGVDHWEPDRYRGVPFVRRGIHRLTPNAMYTFAPTILLAPVLFLGSGAALAATVFNTAYLWTHYVCTEKPDLRTIYGPVADRS